jgi:hypothetical protein
MRKHPWYRLTLSLRPYAHVFIPTCNFPMPPWTLPPMPLGHCKPHRCSQEAPISRFTISILPLSRNPQAFCLGTTADIRTDPFQYITSIDRRTDCRIWQVVIKMCGNLCFILHGWTLHPYVSTCFKQEVCYVDHDRDTPQNHGSWTSIELWRREPEMINPVKSKW